MRARARGPSQLTLALCVQAGGKALPVFCDIRDEDKTAEAVQAAVDRFGGIDMCVGAARGRAGAALDSLSLARGAASSTTRARFR